MRARFAFPMQSTGRGIAAAPESAPRTQEPASARPRTRAGPRVRKPAARQEVLPQYRASP